MGDQYSKSIQDDLRSYRNKVEGLSQTLTRNQGTTFWQNVHCAKKSADLCLDLIAQFEISKMTGLELGEDLSIEERGRAFEKSLALEKDPSLLKELSGRVEIRLSHLKEIYDDFPQTLDSINSASVILLWSALEFLAAELWSEAVDAGPRSVGRAAAEWALNTLVFGPWQRRQLGRAFSDDNFKVGRFLRQNILDFSSAKRIASYYETIFPGVMLSGWVRRTARLQAARNSLLHNGGEVNERFLRLASAPRGVRRTQLRFGQVQVLVFSEATLELGLVLLHAVDSWLASQPGRSPGRSASVH